MVPQFEALAGYLSASPEQIGAVQILLPRHLQYGESWILERVVGLREWSTGTQSGLECQTENCEWHSAVVIPAEAYITRSWSTRDFSWNQDAVSN